MLGHAPALLSDPLGFLERISRDHGDVVEFRLPGQYVVLFNHPSAIEDVLLTHASRIVKDDFTRRLSLAVGNGLLTSEGELWRRQRKLAQPAFHHQRIRSYAETMVRHGLDTVRSFVPGETRDIHADMMRLTLDIVAETLFGVDIGGEAREIGEALEILSARFASYEVLVPPWVPSPSNRRLRRALARLDEIVYGIIRSRRRDEDRGDLLSMLLSATTEEGGFMDERQLRDEVVTLLLAGHETTALVLTYALHLLGRHPEKRSAFEAEVDRVLGTRSATHADLSALVLGDRVVRETMRLYPPAWALGREVKERCTIAGWDLPEKTQIWLAQWIVQRDPRFFPDPLSFRPERWEGDFGKQLPRFAYFPFGGGQRICIGNSFATMEAVLLLATITQHVRLFPEEPLSLAPSVTLRPAGPVKMRVERRLR